MQKRQIRGGPRAQIWGNTCHVDGMGEYGRAGFGGCWRMLGFCSGCVGRESIRFLGSIIPPSTCQVEVEFVIWALGGVAWLISTGEQMGAGDEWGSGCDWLHSSGMEVVLVLGMPG